MQKARKNHFILLISLMLLFSCLNRFSNKNEHSENSTINTVIEKKGKIKNLISVKYPELFNIKLVGLTKDAENKKRYYIDFPAACMCDSPSILLKEQKAYFFSYCKDTLPPLSKDYYYTYDIIENIEINKGVSISLKNVNNENLNLFFKKSDNEFIYELKVKGAFPKDYIGSNLCEFFTYKTENFEIVDCGDFDG